MGSRRPSAAQMKLYVSLLPKSTLLPPEQSRGNQTLKFKNEPVGLFLINTTPLMSQQKPIGFVVVPNNLIKPGFVSLRGEEQYTKQTFPPSFFNMAVTP